MSARNRPDQKKLRRLRKALRRTPPAYFDLVEWLKVRRYAQTSGAAERLILDKRVKTMGNNTIGVMNLPVQQPDGKIEKQDFPIRHQPTSLLDDGIRVVEA